MSDLKQRAENAMIGLAIGDALSWTSMFKRSFLLPPWTRRMRREMEAAAEVENLTLQPLPFSLNQQPEFFHISPTSSTEWAAFSTDILLKHKSENYGKSVYDEWKKLSMSDLPIRGSVSIRAAIKNINKGLIPPQTGKENPQYFDDTAMSRAIPIGVITSGNPDKAAYLAGMDASVTNSEDGIWAAQAIASSISVACAGESVAEVIKAAKNYLPDSSWIKRTVDEALLITKKDKSIFNVIPELQNSIVNREYSYGNIAPETLAIALSIIQLHGKDFVKAVTTAICFPKSSETLPAIVGALSGSLFSGSVAGTVWLDSIRLLQGICIPSLSGISYLEIVEQLSIASGKYL